MTGWNILSVMKSILNSRELLRKKQFVRDQRTAVSSDLLYIYSSPPQESIRSQDA